MSDSRLQALSQWLHGHLGDAMGPLQPASSDASFRRYFRVQHGSTSYIAMDAPPPQEDCAPFVKVAQLLQQAGLHGPKVLQQDLQRGFLLLTDLGGQTFLQAMAAGHDPEPLMHAAIQALVQWQQASRAGELPDYDAALLQRELDLFPEWYIGRHLGRELSDEQGVLWQTSCQLLVAAALAQPRVWVHRDYMPRNLMLSQPNPGILDFQDAVMGPLTYDVISLFKDAFWSWPEARVDAWLKEYHSSALAAGLPVPAQWSQFRRACDWMGLQRHLKVLGIFARINYRDGKPQYLQDTPRFLNYVAAIVPRYPELAPLARLLRSLELLPA